MELFLGVGAEVDDGTVVLEEVVVVTGELLFGEV